MYVCMISVYDYVCVYVCIFVVMFVCMYVLWVAPVLMRGFGLQEVIRVCVVDRWSRLIVASSFRATHFRKGGLHAHVVLANVESNAILHICVCIYMCIYFSLYFVALHRCVYSCGWLNCLQPTTKWGDIVRWAVIPRPHKTADLLVGRWPPAAHKHKNDYAIVRHNAQHHAQINTEHIFVRSYNHTQKNNKPQMVG